MKTLVTIITILLLSACGHSQNAAYHTRTDLKLQHCFPELRKGESVVYHKGFALVYNETYEQAAWVGYMLTRQRVNGTVPRQDNFREDTAIVTKSAQLEDYRGSGYDRGHLCPSGSMKWDVTANDESFLLSNMSPQEKRFNAGLWNTIEDRVREWAKIYDTIYVFTGPVFTPNMPTIGSNRVAVPTAYYKVVYIPSLQQAIGLIVPHLQQKAKWYDFAVAVDEVETRTGINFLKGIPNESAIEKTMNLRFWQQKAKKHK